MEWNGMERNGINMSFHCLDSLQQSCKKFTFHPLPPKLDGTKLRVKWWYGMESIPFHSVVIFIIQTVEH
jgi:hypothetical protein